ncbi:ABC transporter permease [Kineococcus glutinatus]|uniref:ABC transporter permease n=1 Tax=Kineococcus glutinatus TaxID=1070872 RepID=A0ABP9HKJ2_9ACTN
MSAPAQAPAAAGAPSPARSRRGAPVWALGAVLPLLLLVLWQLAGPLGWFTASQLPPPLDVLRGAQDLAATGELQRNVAISTQRVLLGFAAGSVLGVVLGGLVGLSRAATALLMPTLGALRAVPSLAWVPLLGLWIGLGEPPKIVLVAIGAFFPVFTTVSSALRHLDPALVEVGRAYGRRGARLFGELLLPAIAPSVLAGLRLALAQSWLFLVAAELISSSMGLGYQLQNSGNQGRVDLLLLAILLLALLGKLSDVLLGLLERRVARGRE